MFLQCQIWFAVLAFQIRFLFQNFSAKVGKICALSNGPNVTKNCQILVQFAIETFAFLSVISPIKATLPT